MKYFNSAIFIIAILILSNISAIAQETEVVVVDEVIAQVNDSVITLSQVKREIISTVDSLVQEKNVPRAEALADVESKRAQLIASMINEELLLQRAKEFGMDSTIEAEINQRFLQNMKQMGLKTLDQLYKQMEAQGLEPDEIREFLRKQITKDLVLQNEVDRKVYQGWKTKEVKAYFEANKAKFTQPETVTISEIFLSFAGFDEATIREKAKKIVEQTRNGGSFAQLAVENSDRPNAKETMGKAGTFKIEGLEKQLDPRFAEAIKKLKVGEVTDPIDADGIGMEIIYVDDKTKASNESVFDDVTVRSEMTYKILPEARKKYLIKLRADSYIKISDNYRAEVAPILFADEREKETKAPAESGK